MTEYKTPEQGRRLATVVLAAGAFGRPMVATPGIGAERVKILRDAFNKSVTEPEFVAETKKRKFDLDPVSGEEMESLAKEVIHQPPEVVEAMEDAGTVDLRGNCAVWQTPVNCVSLHRVENRFGDGDGLYTPTDFHPACAITNYQSAANVQDCELFSLPDLNTGLASVRQKIADYLLMLARVGVAGFRIDAAKHIQQVDLDTILYRVNTTLTAESRRLPYVFLEVAGGTGEALAPRDYFGAGYSSGGAADITEFTFTGVGDKFRRIGGQFIAQLNPNGTPGNRFSETAWGLMPSDKAVVFLQNHDTQHLCGIGYRDGNVFRLANVWMLAQPYGYPSMLSSYAFNCPTGNAMGPPSDAGGNTRDVACAASLETATVGQWVCEHRDPYLRTMVGFRRVVAGTVITNWWDNGANAIAFSRGDQGFVAINRESVTLVATVPTGLSPGTYCDRLTGGIGAGGASCVGSTLVVDAPGTVALVVIASISDAKLVDRGRREHVGIGKNEVTLQTELKSNADQRVEIAMSHRAPRCSAGEKGAVWRMPPSPYHAPSTSIAGKKNGSAAEAMTCSMRTLHCWLLRCGRSHPGIAQSSRVCTHVIDCPVV